MPRTKSGSQWPLERREQLRNLFERGHSYKQIGMVMDCAECTVRRQADHMGLPRRDNPLPVKASPRPKINRGKVTLAPLPSLHQDR